MISKRRKKLKVEMDSTFKDGIANNKFWLRQYSMILANAPRPSPADFVKKVKLVKAKKQTKVQQLEDECETWSLRYLTMEKQNKALIEKVAFYERKCELLEKKRRGKFV